MDYFTSDTHFGHKNILMFCKRPFKNVDQMNEALIERWNSVVTDKDTVYHLGDFSFRGYWRFRNRLNGNIIIIRGNHDNDEMSTVREATINVNGRECYLSHMPPTHSQKDFCLCGHVHTEWKYLKRGNKVIVNVGSDLWDYTPVTMKQIMDYVRNNEPDPFIKKRNKDRRY